MGDLQERRNPSGYLPKAPTDRAMTLERSIARLFRLDDETWRRHANPWSAVLRNTALPLLVLASWSRLWLGWWALVSVVGALLCAEPGSTRGYSRRPGPSTTGRRRASSASASGSTGTRCRSRSTTARFPTSSRRSAASARSSSSGGVSVFEPWPTLFGAALVYLGKLWFLDRMVWLCRDMRDTVAMERQ